MSRKFLIPLAFLVVMLAAPAWAQEVVHFTNGTTMVIESHSIDEGRVRVQLDDDAFLEFPLEQIDKIETAHGEAALPRPGANRIVPRPTAEAGVVRGSVPPRHRRGQWQPETEPVERDDIDVDRNGMAVYRPFGKSASPNKRQIGVTGNQELRTAAPRTGAGNGRAGATRVGSRNVLPPSGNESKMKPTGVAARSRTVSPPPKKKN